MTIISNSQRGEEQPWGASPPLDLLLLHAGPDSVTKMGILAFSLRELGGAFPRLFANSWCFRGRGACALVAYIAQVGLC